SVTYPDGPITCPESLHRPRVGLQVALLLNCLPCAWRKFAFHDPLLVWTNRGCDGTPVGSIPQQLVDRSFCARRFVDAFNDHRAIEARARFSVLGRLAGQRARNDDRIGRHLTAKYFSGPPIDDPARGAPENPPA